MTTDQDTTATHRDFINDLRTLVSEAEAIISDSAGEPSADGVDSMHSRFAAAQERFAATCARARTRVVAGAKSADQAIRANPYQSLAIAAGVGLLVGVLVGRRNK